MFLISADLKVLEETDLIKRDYSCGATDASVADTANTTPAAAADNVDRQRFGLVVRPSRVVVLLVVLAYMSVIVYILRLISRSQTKEVADRSANDTAGHNQ
ncbi:hypothetical protein HPB48_006101 [Haemaphysalis longicornis]|uniref:Uncharacterized protein n=1 Tax=Haemaphysalis longicornis TaxID=44386 RepID=A0A9J6GUQ9_HAELO|nr:hypothetical protein HPB48_006101 [Haemaphysalis longicornis]